jgi:hypothetical protein
MIVFSKIDQISVGEYEREYGQRFEAVLGLHAARVADDGQ